MIENIIIYMDQYLDQNLFKIINFEVSAFCQILNTICWKIC